MSASETVVILGATSGIAQALSRVLAQRGCRLLLAGRDAERLHHLANDLRLRESVQVAVEIFDAQNFDEHLPFVQRCVAHFQGELTGVVYCAGYLTNQTATQENVDAARATIDVNLTAAVTLLHGFAMHLEQQRAGYVVAISSVAGDRGRQSNYSYGAAKAGLNVFLEGLRHRLYRAGVAVITVKAGPADTRMLEGIMDPHAWQVTSPERMATLIDRAIRQRRSVVYVPGYWRWIMGVICRLPAAIFHRTRL